MSPAETVRSQTCGRAALREVMNALREMRARAVESATTPASEFTKDERAPAWVRAYALRDAFDTVDATEYGFRCPCPACSAEDAAGVAFGEPLDGIVRCEACREPAEYVSATAAEVASCGKCRPAFDAEPENAGVTWYVLT